MITINEGRRETMAYLQEVECDLCDQSGVMCLLILTPPPWSGVNICRQCWDKLGSMWQFAQDEPPGCGA